MKFRPSWKFWINVVNCLVNLFLFVMSKNDLFFAMSIFCCACALIVWKLEKLLFDFEQEQLKKSFEEAKKEQEDKDVDF